MKKKVTEYIMEMGYIFKRLSVCLFVCLNNSVILVWFDCFIVFVVVFCVSISQEKLDGRSEKKRKKKKQAKKRKEKKKSNSPNEEKEKKNHQNCMKIRDGKEKWGSLYPHSIQAQSHDSHPIREVKHRWTVSVLRWSTT